MRYDYETMIITSTKVGENYEKEVEKYQEIISANNGTVEKVDRWGEKRLAYEISGMNSGLYLLLTFKGDRKTINELDKRMKYDENVLRHMIIRKGM